MRVEPFALALETPLSTAAGTVERRRGFVVTDEYEGSVGVGEASPLAGWTEPYEACRDALADHAEKDADESILTELSKTPAARHGVELALLDRRARTSGQSLYRHLGGEERVESVPVNATVGDAPVAETVTAARDACDRGFRTLKIKIGARPVAEDLRRLRAVREAVGDGVTLRADANGAWTREEAERALDAIADIGVAYVEQPVPGDDLPGLAALQAHEVPVAADEALAVNGVEATLASADVVVCKPMALGGPGRAREVAMRALDASVRPVVTTTIDAVLARTAAVHVAASLPERPACGLATADLLADDLAADPAPVADGRIRVPQSPGVGVEPAEVRLDG
jgi:o-succinylbenzoate synthase